MAKLVLVRHGQSVWNLRNVFTGWVDVPLTADGITEATNAGKEMADIDFDIIYTSVQVRALQTAMIAMAYNNSPNTPVVIHAQGKMADWAKIYNETMQNSMIPVIRDWHLNERYYGETAARTIPFFKENILPKLEAGQNILVSAHGNSLRSIVMYLDNLSKEAVVKLEIPTGKPIYYEMTDGKLEKKS